MTALPRRIGTVLAVLGLAYLVAFGMRHAAELPELRWDGRAAAGLALAVGLHGLTVLSGAAAWRALLRSLGERLGFGDAVGILAVSQAAKYLPGNVGHYVGRVALARERGIATGSVILTLVVETACAVLAGLAVAAGGAGTAAAVEPWRLAVAVLTAVAAVAALAVAAILLRREGVRRRLRLPETLPEPRRLAGAGLVCLGLCGVNFLIFGACAAVLARTFFGAPAVPLPALTALFAAAWVAGFVTPGAPAGLGVREAILVAGLRPLCGPGVALGLPVLFRVVTTLGDGLAFGLGWMIWNKRWRKSWRKSDV